MKNTFIYIILILLYSSVISSPKWYIEVVDNTYCVGDYSSLKLDSNDYPHISYWDYGYKVLRYAYFDGSKWNIEVVDRAGQVDTSLALDSKGRPHIAYGGESGGVGGLKYAYFDGNSWNIIFVDNTAIADYGLSLALDSKDNPHIAYYNPASEKRDLKYAYFDGKRWKIETVDSNGDVGQYSSIAVDSKDHPHISYDDETNWHLKYAYFDGTKWNIETVDFSGRYTSIDIDKEDNPHISYMGGHSVKYAYHSLGKWFIISLNDEGGFTSLSLDSKDHPHISYFKDQDYPYKDKQLKHAYFDGANWYIEIVDCSPNYVQADSSIDIDSKDFPHISYACDFQLKYARYGYGVGIDLTSFTAKPNNDAITLNWTISTDEEISGFNLYRRVATPHTNSNPVRENSYSPTCSPAPVGEIATFPLQTDDNSHWTKVNTSLITGTNPYSFTDRDITPNTNYEYKLEAVVSDKNETLGTTECTSGKGTPGSFDITRIYPTPASSQISIDVIIPEQSDIDIAIYDITGRRVATVVSGLYNSGEYTITSDVSGLSDGVYIVRMTGEDLSASKSFVIAK